MRWDWDFDDTVPSYDRRLRDAGYLGKPQGAFAKELDRVLREVWNSDNISRQLYGPTAIIPIEIDPWKQIPRLPIE